MIAAWCKVFHIVSMVSWFAGLFYLPRLYVYHAMAEDAISQKRFVVMERKLYFYIMTPAAIATVILGFALIFLHPQQYLPFWWIHIKLALVILLLCYHLYLGKIYFDFAHHKNTHTHAFYRFINEIPTLFLIIIVVLTVIQPFGRCPYWH